MLKRGESPAVSTRGELTTFLLFLARKQGIGTLLFNSVVNWARKERVNWLQWQASESAVKFYEKLGYSGDPCPDPEHPFFEIEFSDRNIGVQNQIRTI